MRNIMDVESLDDEFELLNMPAVRIIGKETKCKNATNAIEEGILKNEEFNKLKELPTILNNCIVQLACEFDSATHSYLSISGVVTKPNTPVPEGFVYKDIPETVFAKGALGERLYNTVKRAYSLGYTTKEKEHLWNAKCIKAGKEHIHCLVPVRKFKNKK